MERSTPPLPFHSPHACAMGDREDHIASPETGEGDDVEAENEHEETDEGKVAEGDGEGLSEVHETKEEDEELEEMKRRVQEMEEEAQKLKQLQSQMEKESGNEGDMRSVFVGNVDYSATPEELQSHFQSCGTINRVTILCDKHSGHPKGFAYIEFNDKDSVANAMLLNESQFRGRSLQVKPKRANMPGFMLRGRGRVRGRGRGFRGWRGRGRGFHPYYY